MSLTSLCIVVLFGDAMVGPASFSGQAFQARVTAQRCPAISTATHRELQTFMAKDPEHRTFTFAIQDL
jgi:hypothetical protein